jgi:hypothetical protein
MVKAEIIKKYANTLFLEKEAIRCPPSNTTKMTMDTLLFKRNINKKINENEKI